MKFFADLQLRVPLNDHVQTKKMVQKAAHLGYQMLGITVPENATSQLISNLKNICASADVDFVSRVNLSPSNSNSLLKDLRKYRRKFEIISVRCNTKDVARQAAKDRRVDLLQFSVTNMRQRFFDNQEAELAGNALSALEIELAPILQLTPLSRIYLLSRLRKEIGTAKRSKVPVILSSAATTEHLMRGPYDNAAVTTLFDFSVESALKALSSNALFIVERNRKKLSPTYVAPGIQVLGLKNCD
ncbi:MAG: RNase P subunit p30 family protein [Candidatus Bathyarchaeota archaeon]|nr:RNase P subunit p30 family protein [Candidatus Bathyarchaeum tardum]